MKNNSLTFFCFCLSFCLSLKAPLCPLPALFVILGISVGLSVPLGHLCVLQFLFTPVRLFLSFLLYTPPLLFKLSFPACLVMEVGFG